jgi:hypothetical protein
MNMKRAKHLDTTETKTVTIRIHKEVFDWIEAKKGKNDYVKGLLEWAVCTYQPSQTPPLYDFPGARERLLVSLPLHLRSDIRFWARHLGIPMASIMRGLLTEAFYQETTGHRDPVMGKMGGVQ